VSGGCASSGTPLCTDGATLTDADVLVRKAGAPLGDEVLRIKGRLFFPGGIPVDPLDGGAQLLLEDLGSGGAAVFDLTTATAPVPSSSVTGCDPAEGWKLSTKTARYRNRSGSLDPPACTEGSANGLTKLLFKKRSAELLELKASTKGSTIGSIVGPLRATLVLGDDDAAGDAGHCGVSLGIPCFANTSGTTVRCR
jgi:hypothetical protein